MRFLFYAKTNGVETLFYDSESGSIDQTIISPKIKLELSKAGTLEFTILPNHPMFDSFQKLKTYVRVMMDDYELFRGRVLQIEDSTYFERNIQCEGDLAYLIDSLQYPDKTESKTSVSNITKNNRGYRGDIPSDKLQDYPIQTVTVDTVDLLSESSEHESAYTHFVRYITVHNNQMEPEKRFTAGNMTIDNKDVERDFTSTSYRNTKSAFDSDLIRYTGGFLQTRKENGVVYIDYLKEPLIESTQKIVLGINIVDLQKKVSGSEIFTRLIPVGNKQLTIGSVNGGVDYIQNDAGYAKYGAIYRTENFSVNTPADLMSLGEQYMETHYKDDPINFTIKAIDMNMIDGSIDAIRLGSTVNVVSEPHGIDLELIVTSIEYDIQNPENNTYEIGDASETLSSKANNDGLETAEAVSSASTAGHSAQAGVQDLETTVNRHAASIADQADGLFSLKADTLKIDSRLIQIESDMLQIKTKAISIEASTVGIIADYINLGDGRIILTSDMTADYSVQTFGNVYFAAGEVTVGGNLGAGSFSDGNLSISGGNVSHATSIYSNHYYVYSDWDDEDGYSGVTELSNAVASFGQAVPDGQGRISIPYNTLTTQNAGTITFNMADTAWYAGQVSAFKTAVSTALGNAIWNASTKPTQIYAYLNTSTKKLTIQSAVAKISYPGEQSPTDVSISLPNLDVSTVLTSYYNSVKVDSISASDVPSGTTRVGNIEVTATASNNETKTAIAALTKTTYSYLDGSTVKTDNCVDVTLDGRTIGRINTQSVYSAGQNSVNVTSGVWSGGSNTYSPSAGTGSPLTVSLSTTVTKNSQVDHNAEVKIYAANNGGTPAATGAVTELYLKTDSGHAYISKEDTTPSGTSDTKVVAYASIPQSNRSVSTLGAITLTASDISTSTKYPLITYDDSSTENNHSISIDASAVYNAVTLTKSWAIEASPWANDPNGEYLSNTLTVTASNKEKASQAIRLLQGEWGTDPGASMYNKKYVYMVAHATATGASYRRARTLINGASVFNRGQNNVSVVKGSWSSGAIDFVPSYGTATGRSASVNLTAGTQTWANNVCTFNVLDGGDNTGLTCTIDASDIYTAGANDITLTKSWNSSAPNTAVSNTLTVTPSSTASPATQLVRLYQDPSVHPDNDSNKYYVYILDSVSLSSDPHRVARLVVNATERYEAGQNSVNVTASGWGNGSNTYSPSAGTGSSMTVVLSTDVAKRSSDQATVYVNASTNGGAVSLTGAVQDLYLKTDSNYAYISKSSNPPTGTSDPNVVLFTALPVSPSANVNVVKGTWDEGSITFSPSSGSGSSQTLSLTHSLDRSSTWPNSGTSIAYLRTMDGATRVLNTPVYLKEDGQYAYISTSSAQPSYDSSSVIARVGLSSTPHVDHVGEITLTTSDVGEDDLVKTGIVYFTNSVADFAEVHIDTSGISIPSGQGVSVTGVSIRNVAWTVSGHTFGIPIRINYSDGTSDSSFKIYINVDVDDYDSDAHTYLVYGYGSSYGQYTGGSYEFSPTEARGDITLRSNTYVSSPQPWNESDMIATGVTKYYVITATPGGKTYGIKVEGY